MRTQSHGPQRNLLPNLITCLVLVFIWLGAPLDVMAEGVGCDDTFVQLGVDSTVINVSTTGVDDTANIQCALNEAQKGGYPIVRLAAGTFFISRLSIENFKGTLEGKARISTIINVMNESIDCGAMKVAGMQSTAIRFSKGEPRLRYMTIRADQPCMESGKNLNTLLNFTGAPGSFGDCSSDVIFGVVDRVNLEGTDIETSPWRALLVSAEARSANIGGCNKNLLGTFKLNRSKISNMVFGVGTSMQSGAQVDINFNEFDNVRQPIQLFNSNQNTTITANSIFGNDPMLASFAGVEILALAPDAPKKNRVVIHNNIFTIDAFETSTFRSAIIAPEANGITDVSLIIKNNQFNLDGATVSGIFVWSFSNTHVSANKFTGSSSNNINVTGNIPASGWTITANSFAGIVDLGTNTTKCIVGPGQGATVHNEGSNNTVLRNRQVNDTLFS